MDAETLKAAIRGSAPPRRQPLSPDELQWAWEIIREVNLLRASEGVKLPTLAEATGYTVNHLQPSLSGRRVPGRGLMLALEKWLKDYNGVTTGSDDGADKWSAIANEESDSLLNLIGGGND